MAIGTEAVTFTAREVSVLRFALKLFIDAAHSHRDAAAQDKANARYKPGAVEAFSRDIDDAKALLAKFPGADRG